MAAVRATKATEGRPSRLCFHHRVSCSVWRPKSLSCGTLSKLRTTPLIVVCNAAVHIFSLSFGRRVQHFPILFGCHSWKDSSAERRWRENMRVSISSKLEVANRRWCPDQVENNVLLCPHTVVSRIPPGIQDVSSSSLKNRPRLTSCLPSVG